MPVHVLFGRTRWARRRGVAALVEPTVDRFGRPTTLYVTGTWRKRAQLLRDLGERPGFPPDVVVFEAWVAEAWRRCGDGRAMLSERAAILAARQGARADDDPILAEALARAERTTAVHGRAPADPQVARRVAALRTELDALPGHAREAVVLERLVRLLDAGDADRFVARHRAVVLDDLSGLSPLAARVCVAACRAWSRAGATVVLSFAVGRDRGGLEVGQALGFEEADDREARVFEPTKVLRTVVFEELVASGEAVLVRSAADGVEEVEPGVPLPVGPGDLADDLAGGRAVSRADAGPVRVGALADPRAEIEHVARDLRAVLADGADPRDCLVALGSPLYEPLVEEIFADHDLPWERGGGRPAAGSPTLLAVKRAMTARDDGLPARELLALAVAVGLPEARTVASWCRAAGVRKGAPETWAPRLKTWAVRSKVDEAVIDRALLALTALVDRLPAGGPCGPDELEARVRAAIALLPDPDAAVHVALLDGARSLAVDLAASGPAASAPPDVIRGFLDDLRVPHPGPPVARVPVVGLREILGLTPVHVWVVGLARGSFPAPRRPSPLLGPDDPVDHDPVAEGRALLAALWRDALGEPWMRSVTLTWPAAVDGRLTAVSPLLGEALELPFGDGRLGDVLPAPLPPPPLAGRRDRWRAAAADPAARAGLTEAERARLAAVEEVVRSRTGPVGRRDGMLRLPPRPRRELPVTTLETWLRCPQRYWYRHELGLGEAELWSPELEPRRRGTALHRILEAFLLDRDLRPLAGDPGDAAADLRRVAEKVLDEVEAEGGFDPVFQRWARDRWLAGLTDDRPHGLLRAWLTAELLGPPRVPEAVERRFEGLPVGPLTLRGTIDRVDRLPGGARVVTDYKTGRAPTREEVLLGLSLQPVAYLAATARAAPDLPVAASFLQLARPDDVKRTAWTGHPEALRVAADERERRAATSLDADGVAAVLQRAGDAAERLLRGEFPPSPHPPDRAGCPTCPFRTVCRRDDERHGAVP